MRAIAIDTETCPIVPGLLAPPLVVLSYALENDAALKSRQEAASFITGLATEVASQPNVVLIGHNVAYDAVVLSAHHEPLLKTLFALYDARKIYDTMINEQLRDIRDGSLRKSGYALDALAKRYLGRELDKSSWRLKYGMLMDTPLENWPQGAVDYAVEDADVCRELFELQKADAALVNAPEQAKYAFSQQLMCTWGIRTDPERVDDLKATLEREQHLLGLALEEHGLITRDKRGRLIKPKAPLQELVSKAFGGEPPMTAKGSISTDRKTLLATHDPALKAYSEYVSNEKLLSTYLPVLEEGTRYPINASFRMVESGRRGATKNMQTPPKKEGVRECYVPRPGFVFCSCDYDSLELRALAQIQLDLFGESPLADLYRADPHADPHTKFAAENFLGVSYEEGMRRKKAKDPDLARFRHAAKAYNFGLPGGLGHKTFVNFARDQYGFLMSEDEAYRGKAAWIQAMRMRPFFDYVQVRAEHYGSITLPRSQRTRGGISFCDGANYLFQGPAADGACEAHYRVARECYTEADSPLHGCRIVNFMHDELILEMPEWKASAASKRLSAAMNDAMRVYLPDVPICSSPVLMRYWSKKADSVFDEAGNLQVWSAAA